MDERVKNAYQKIYSELCSLIVLGTACSLIIKILVFHMEPKALITEFAILVGAPLYLWIRQTMLGLDPYSDADRRGRKARKNFWLSFSLGVAVMTAVMILYEGRPTVQVLVNVLSFALCFSAVYIGSRSFARWNAERKAKKYDED